MTMQIVGAAIVCIRAIQTKNAATDDRGWILHRRPRQERAAHPSDRGRYEGDRRLIYVSLENGEPYGRT